MENLNYLKSIRRAIHASPELSNSEFKTQALIISELEKFSVKFRLVDTGVIADISGKDKNVIVLRADMDALPLQEQNECEYCSKTEGVMHACGHDGHIAMLLTLIKNICENSLDLPYSVRFVFQPAEEHGGGALRMIEAGALEDALCVYGLHVSPDYNVGEIATNDEALFAGAFDHQVEFFGKNAHCSCPEKGIDALASAAEYYHQSYKLFKKLIKGNNLHHIGSIHAGTATNIVADYAKCECTLRYFDALVKQEYLAMVNNLLYKIQNKFGVRYKLTATADYPPLVNDKDLTRRLMKVFPSIKITKPKYTAEDFAEYLKKVKGCFAWLGIRDETYNQPLHNSRFDFDEKALIVGVDYYTKIITLGVQ